MVTTRSAATLRASILFRVSDDLALYILSFLDVERVCALLLLNKRFLYLCSSDILWHALLQKKLGASNLPPAPVPPSSWRLRFWQWNRLDACGYAGQAVQMKAPEARFLHRAACVDGRWLYVFGGKGKDGEFDDLWVLDHEQVSSDDAWRIVHPQGIRPEQRLSATLTAVGHELLMFGGRQGDATFMDDTWVFDTKGNSWSCVSASGALTPRMRFNKPSPRWAHSAVRFGERVLFFGGSSPGHCFCDLHWFDMRTRQWSLQLPANLMPPERSGHCACAVKDSMFIFGGNTTKASFNDLWEYVVPTFEWIPLKAEGQAPSGRVGHTITAVGSRLLVLGGRDYTTNSFDSSMYSFNVRTRMWIQVPLDSSADVKVPPVRTGHCTTVYGGQLFMFGGLRDDGTFLDDITAIKLLA
ncbi:hypothetical protein AB1Y20_010154 [Prymnesium parvum]|uniref:F-box domain-containing protein n=1 Tax=Prymnesium parvum TaxID=97485 RepID=A0AB34JRH3_PRYPA